MQVIRVTMIIGGCWKEDEKKWNFQWKCLMKCLIWELSLNLKDVFIIGCKHIGRNEDKGPRVQFLGQKKKKHEWVDRQKI